MPRDLVIRVRVSKEELRRLKEIQKHDGLENISEAIRACIRDKYQKIAKKK